MLHRRTERRSSQLSQLQLIHWSFRETQVTLLKACIRTSNGLLLFAAFLCVVCRVFSRGDSDVLSLSLSLSLSVHGHLSQSFPGSRTPYFLDGIVTRYPARFITIIVAVWQLGRLICPRLYRHFGVALTGLRMAGIQSTSYVFRRS